MKNVKNQEEPVEVKFAINTPFLLFLAGWGLLGTVLSVFLTPFIGFPVATVIAVPLGVIYMFLVSIPAKVWGYLLLLLVLSPFVLSALRFLGLI